MLLGRQWTAIKNSLQMIEMKQCQPSLDSSMLMLFSATRMFNLSTDQVCQKGITVCFHVSLRLLLVMTLWKWQFCFRVHFVLKRDRYFLSLNMVIESQLVNN